MALPSSKGSLRRVSEPTAASNTRNVLRDKTIRQPNRLYASLVGELRRKQISNTKAFRVVSRSAASILSSHGE